MRGRTGRNLSASTGRRTARSALVVSAVGAVVCALVGVGSASAAPITVGSPLTVPFTKTVEHGVGTVINSALGEAGAHVTSPVTGTVTRWHVSQASGGPFFLELLTPDGGSTYTGAGTSAGEVPASTAIQTFTTDLPVKAGQTIALNNSNNNDTIGIATMPGSAISVFVPPVTSGSTATALASESGEEAGFNAIVQPLPTVSGLSRRSGLKRGGRKITIRGRNFDGTTAVLFGKKKAKSFKVVSDTRIHAVAPRHHAGVVHVTVYNPAKSAPDAASRFRYKKSA